MSARLRLVLLCAGASTRLGEPKALARFGPHPEDCALLALLAAARVLGEERPLVVSGAEHERLVARLPPEVECVRNPHWHSGRSSSIQLARELRPAADLCLAPCDVPRVPPAVFAALARAWSAAGSPPEGWLAPCMRRPEGLRHGHPLVLGQELLLRLKDFPPDRPLRALRALARPLLAVEVESATILEDLDTPADLARLRRLGTDSGADETRAQDPRARLQRGKARER